MAMSTGVLDASEYIGKLICGRFVASVTGEYSRLGVFNISGTTGTFRLGVYDAATDALLAQTPSITPSSTPLQPGDFKVLWTATENPFTLVAGHEYYFAVAGFGNNLTVRLLMREISPGPLAYVSGSVSLMGTTDNPLPDPKPAISLAAKQVWIACK